MKVFETVLETASNIGVANIIVLICLLMEGALIKHLKWFKFIPNKLIPFILIGTGVIITAIGAQNVDPSVIINGIIAAVLATGSHQIGKLSWIEIANNTLKSLRTDLDMPTQGDTTYVTEKLDMTPEQVEEVKETVEKVEEIVEKVIETVVDNTENIETEPVTETTIEETTEENADEEVAVETADITEENVATDTVEEEVVKTDEPVEVAAPVVKKRKKKVVETTTETI